MCQIILPYLTLYIVSVRNTLQKIFEKYTPNDEYEKFVNALFEVVAVCIPTKPNAECRVPRESLLV